MASPNPKYGNPPTPNIAAIAYQQTGSKMSEDNSSTKSIQKTRGKTTYPPKTYKHMGSLAQSSTKENDQWSTSVKHLTLCMRISQLAMAPWPRHEGSAKGTLLNSWGQTSVKPGGLFDDKFTSYLLHISWCPTFRSIFGLLLTWTWKCVRTHTHALYIYNVYFSK